MSKAFEDTSIVQGWVEFENDHGRKYRCIRKGQRMYFVYEKMENAYIKIGAVHIDTAPTPKALYSLILEMLDE